MGGHLVHLLHWLSEETEKGGTWAGAGIVLGLVIGYVANPIMHPGELCTSDGIGKDALGSCPDVFDVERLLVVLLIGVVGGLVGMVIGYVASGGQPAE